MGIKEETNCRVCAGELKVVLDLGSIYPSSFLRDDEKVSEDSKQPLVLAECENCGLVQLKHTIDLDSMYKQYWYSSSLNKSMVSSLKDIVQEIESRGILDSGDTVLDIGCNDGTLLELYSYPERLVQVGFDPALNVANGDYHYEFINDYFSAEKCPQNFPKAKIITAIAMFYDLPDPNKFVSDVASVLRDDGIFVIQFTDLASMIRVNAFDNICHEHLEYYRLEDINNLLEVHGLEIISVSYNDVNGGSLRVTASHRGAYKVDNGVQAFLIDEFNYLSTHGIKYFKENIEMTKFKLKSFLYWAKGQGLTVHLMGASTKGNSLLQICDITKDDIPYAAEVNKEKFGLRTVGSNIQIISEEESLIKHPDYYIVAVWHFKHSLLSNPKIIDYLNSNGRLVFPLPDFAVFTNTGGFQL